MAQGKFSKPRQTKSDGTIPVTPTPSRPVVSDPIETVPQEVAAFFQDQAFRHPGEDSWQDQTRIVPTAAQDSTEDWRNQTRIVPDNWRDATQVVSDHPRQEPRPIPFTPPTPQVREEWDFEEPRPLVRNHMIDREDAEDYDYEPPARNLNRKILLISICVLILVGLLGGIFVAVNVFGGSPEEDDGLILANVVAAGVDLGGMTPAQAQVALYQATDDTYTRVPMTVTMPDGVILLDPRDTGASLDVEAVVDAAFHYGRKGTKTENQKAKEQALQGQVHTIALLPYLQLNEDYIRTQLTDYEKDFNSTYSASSYILEGTKPELAGDKFDESAPCQTLVIETGTPGRGMDADEVYDQILDAYSFHKFEVTALESIPAQSPKAIDLDKIFKEICSTPIDAYMDMQTFEVITETYGYTFDLEKAKALLAEAEYGDTLEIPMEYIIPEIMGEKLEEMLFRDVLASYETPTTSDNNRNTNLKLACQAVNGTLLNPGDSFSFNDVVGKRTEAGGYKQAAAYFDGETVQEVGGGICQVSSTLYACVLMADLDVTARSAHSFPVAYMPKGMDAAVSWGGPEFKFRNNTDYPIRIDAAVSGGMVKVQLIGTDERDYYVKVECKETETIEPEILYQDFSWDNAEGYTDGQVLEEGVTGSTVKTYLRYYSKENDSFLRETVEATSNYKSKPSTVARVEPKPTEPPTQPPTEEPSVQDVIEDIIDLIT